MRSHKHRLRGLHVGTLHLTSQPAPALMKLVTCFVVIARIEQPEACRANEGDGRDVPEERR